MAYFLVVLFCENVMVPANHLLIIFAREDRRRAKMLGRHLTPLVQQGLLTIWDNETVLPGSDPAVTLLEQLAVAHLVLLLISADMVASAWWASDLPALLQRHQRGAVRVVVLLIRPVYLAGSPIEGLMMLPRNRRWVSTWGNEDKAFCEIVTEIRNLLDVQANRTINSNNEHGENAQAPPCRIRVLSLELKYQLWRQLCRLIRDETAIIRIARELGLGPLPTSQPPEVLWSELLRQHHNADGDVAPLIHCGRQIEPANKLWQELTNPVDVVYKVAIQERH